MTSSYATKLAGRDVKHVVIVYPYTYVNPHVSFPPIGAEYLQAGAIEAGVQTTLLDMRFETDIRAQLAEADVVCLYGFFEDCSMFGKWGIHVIDEVIDQVPERTPIVGGGTGFGKALETLAERPRIDVIVEGTPNVPIQQLLEAGSPEGIPNLAWRSGHETTRNPRVTHRLSDTVYPRRKLRNPAYRYHVMGVPADLVRAAMGCNYHCRFCYQYGKDTDGNYLRWQGRSPESQLAELKEIDAPLVFWVDDDMTTDMRALDRLSDLILEHRVEKVMIGTGRVDHIMKSSVADLKKLERAGFLGLAFGVEALDDETLHFYRKGQTVEMVEKAMTLVTQTNILLFCNFLLGSPGETEEEMMRYLAFGRRWNIDHLVTNRLRVPEGSMLHKTITDPATGLPKPGMARIRGRELKAIKNRIKFGQMTPLRILMTLLKLHRHEGLHLDPLYFTLSTLETFAKGTWLDRTRILPVLFWLPKRMARLRLWRKATRLLARLLTPPVVGANRLFEGVDERLELSTTLLPRLFGALRGGLLRRQKEEAQAAHGRAIDEGQVPHPTRPKLA